MPKIRHFPLTLFRTEKFVYDNSMT